MATNEQTRTVLWWGRFDPNYSRNRILRTLLVREGWKLQDFHPRVSQLGDLEAFLKNMIRPDLIWIPCFRQRDLTAAKRYARLHHIPVLFDPLISAYDKRVYERQKITPDSRQAKHLKKWETKLFQKADLVLADTEAHAQYFSKELKTAPQNIHTVPVGAEEALFQPQPAPSSKQRLEVLFYGSFIPLQGTKIIIDAARLVPEADWILLGDGKLKNKRQEESQSLPHVRFETWIPYDKLADRIGQADILLGIFGATPKAQRVIPNKFYQTIACARPLITMDAPVYSSEIKAAARKGISWIPPASHQALADTVREWIKAPQLLSERGCAARNLYEQFFDEAHIQKALRTALEKIQ